MSFGTVSCYSLERVLLSETEGQHIEPNNSEVEEIKSG